MANEMLASDAANREFTDAHNPDSRLAVRFYEGTLKNEFLSQMEGRPIFSTIDMVTIMVPGDNTSVIDTFADERHKARFPMHWARYQNNKSADGQTIGTPLEQWPLISKSQAEELRALKFFTVDQVASASDQNIGRIGMAGGMAPHAFRTRAQRFLDSAKGEAEINAHAGEMAALKAENERIREEAAAGRASDAEKMAKMQAQLQTLIDNMPKKPGRKPKETLDA